jgi:molybdenum cofactor cytidylyltransferase
VIAALVLAAGASRRLGRNKLLLPFRGGTVLSTTLARMLESPVDRVVLVLGHEGELVRRHAGLPEDPRLTTVDNAQWASGMASSLRTGLAACPEAEAAIVALGDQPDVEAATVARLVDAFHAGAPLAVPVHADPKARGGERVGHPVLFGRALFAELGALEGDTGARQVVERHWASAARVAGVPLRDVDTEADYAALVAGTPAAGEGLESPKDRPPR